MLSIAHWLLLALTEKANTIWWLVSRSGSHTSRGSAVQLQADSGGGGKQKAVVTGPCRAFCPATNCCRGCLRPVLLRACLAQAASLSRATVHASVAAQGHIEQPRKEDWLASQLRLEGGERACGTVC